MKGQRLFVRPASWEEIAETAAALGLPTPPAADRTWIAFLVGDAVAIAGADVDGDSALLQFLLVAERVRGKRVGSVMLRELEADLRSSVNRLAVRKDLLSAAFLERAGFTGEAARISKDLTAAPRG